MKKIALLLVAFPFLVEAQMQDSVVLAKQVDSLLQESDNLSTKQLKHEAALVANEAAIKLVKDNFGDTHPLLASCFLNEGRIYYSIREDDKAKACFTNGKELLEKTGKTEHPDYTKFLGNLANIQSNIGDFEAAKDTYLKLIGIYEKDKESNLFYYSLTTTNLANVYRYQGQYNEAESLLLENIELWENQDNFVHTQYARVLECLGSLYWKSGQYEKAEPVFEEAGHIQRLAQGETSRLYLRILNNKGINKRQLGRFKEAENSYKEAITILKNSGRTGRNLYYPILNLSNLYIILNQNEKAIKVLEDLPIEVDSVEGRDHVHEVATAMLNHARAYYQQGQLSDAEALLSKGIAFLEKYDIQNWGIELNYGKMLHFLGIILIETDRLAQSDTILRKAEAVVKNSAEKNIEAYVEILSSLALLNQKIGEDEKTEKLIQEAYQLFVEVNGEDNNNFSNLLYSLSTLHRIRGNNKEAARFAMEGRKKITGQLLEGRFFLATEDLAKLNQAFSFYNNHAFSLSYDWKEMQPFFISELMNICLFNKGFLLENESILKNRPMIDPIANDLFLDWKGVKRLIAAEYSKPIAERKNVEEMEAKAIGLEEKLVERLPGFDEAISRVEWMDLQSSLNHGEAALEFIHYDYYTPDPTDSLMYAALLLRPGDEQPHFIPLFEERQLKKLLNKEGIKDKNYYSKLYSYDLDASLYSLIWQQLDSLLEGVDKIYASPSGLLHRLNLGAIMSDANHTFADQYELNILGSTRQLVIKNGTVENQNLTAAVYGGIRYEMDSTAIASTLEGRLDTVQFRDAGELSFSYVERSTPQRGRSWDYLPGTAKEVEAITSLVVDQDGKVTDYKGYAATEESIKALGQSGDAPRILHIATHGYFYPDPAVSLKNTSSLDYSPAFKVSDHPMIRSGLIMAGGNHVWKKNPPVAGLEDGILTAYEVSQLDLRNTELAVLSACETGLGDIDGNEGVYGLQRAFKIAGVDKLIMSLWSVPDQQTQEMMVLFYKNWLEIGMEMEDAFRAAQREMRRKYVDHYYWASFVLIK